MSPLVSRYKRCRLGEERNEPIGITSDASRVGPGFLSDPIQQRAQRIRTRVVSTTARSASPTALYEPGLGSARRPTARTSPTPDGATTARSPPGQALIEPRD